MKMDRHSFILLLLPVLLFLPNSYGWEDSVNAAIEQAEHSAVALMREVPLEEGMRRQGERPGR